MNIGTHNVSCKLHPAFSIPFTKTNLYLDIICSNIHGILYTIIFIIDAILICHISMVINDSLKEKRVELNNQYNKKKISTKLSMMSHCTTDLGIVRYNINIKKIHRAQPFGAQGR